MFCKHCGDRIDKNGHCIRCGKPVGPGPLEGGVGFWDLAAPNSRPSQSANIPANVSVKTERIEKLIQEETEQLDKGLNHIYRRQAQVGRTHKLLLMVIAGLLAVNLMIDIMILVAIRGVSDSAPVATVEETEAPTVMTLPTEEVVLPETGEATEETTPIKEPEPTVEENYPNIIITTLPSDVPLSGTKDGEEKLFSIEAEGSELTFKWEKMIENDEGWLPVDSSLLMENTNQVEDGKWQSVLCQRYFDESLYGKYRCVVMDAYGNREESIVVSVNPVD